MGYFKSETVRLYLPSNPADDPERFWVDIKAKLKAGDIRYRNSQTMKAHMNATSDGTDPQMQTEIELGAMQAATLERAIVAWNLTDEADKPVGITPEAIAELDQEDAEFIAAEINQRNPQRSRQEKNV